MPLQRTRRDGQAFKPARLKRALPGNNRRDEPSRPTVNLRTALRKLSLPSVPDLLVTLRPRDLLFGGVLAHVFGDLHGAEVRPAHGTEVCGLRSFLRQGFVVELARGFGIERRD